MNPITLWTLKALKWIEAEERREAEEQQRAVELRSKEAYDISEFHEWYNVREGTRVFTLKDDRGFNPTNLPAQIIVPWPDAPTVMVKAEDSDVYFDPSSAISRARFELIPR